MTKREQDRVSAEYARHDQDARRYAVGIDGRVHEAEQRRARGPGEAIRNEAGPRVHWWDRSAEYLRGQLDKVEDYDRSEAECSRLRDDRRKLADGLHRTSIQRDDLAVRATVAEKEYSRLHAACEAYLHDAERAEARAKAAEKECERLAGQGEFLMRQIATLGVKLDEARARAERLAAVVRWYAENWTGQSGCLRTRPALEPGDLKGECEDLADRLRVTEEQNTALEKAAVELEDRANRLAAVVRWCLKRYGCWGRPDLEPGDLGDE
jgi:DNA repair exonuclease SbcCD ATPase subunit